MSLKKGRGKYAGLKRMGGPQSRNGYMAKERHHSAYVYFVQGPPFQRPIATFTVKHEAVEWVKKHLHRFECSPRIVRMRDAAQLETSERACIQTVVWP